MKISINTKFVITVVLTFFSTMTQATGPYVSEINFIQATKMGHSYNTVHLKNNITNSPCTSTNQFNRFNITSEVQQSVILSALLSEKVITIYGTGSCNGANIETIGDVRIYSGN